MPSKSVGAEDLERVKLVVQSFGRARRSNPLRHLIPSSTSSPGRPPTSTPSSMTPTAAKRRQQRRTADVNDGVGHRAAKRRKTVADDDEDDSGGGGEEGNDAGYSFDGWDDGDGGAAPVTPSASSSDAAQQHGPAVERRNARERGRVRLINDGYDALRNRIPFARDNKKMSKVDTLRSAIEYIGQLQGLLEPPSSSSLSSSSSPTVILPEDDSLTVHDQSCYLDESAAENWNSFESYVPRRHHRWGNDDGSTRSSWSSPTSASTSAAGSDKENNNNNFVVVVKTVIGAEFQPGGIHVRQHRAADDEVVFDPNTTTKTETADEFARGDGSSFASSAKQTLLPSFSQFYCPEHDDDDDDDAGDCRLVLLPDSVATASCDIELAGAMPGLVRVDGGFVVGDGRDGYAAPGEIVEPYPFVPLRAVSQEIAGDETGGSGTTHFYSHPQFVGADGEDVYYSSY